MKDSLSPNLVADIREEFGKFVQGTTPRGHLLIQPVINPKKIDPDDYTDTRTIQLDVAVLQEMVDRYHEGEYEVYWTLDYDDYACFVLVDNPQ